MREHGPAEGDLALVLWPSDAVGARVAFGDFVEHLDDLWAPGRDDVVVVSADRSRIVTFDHEERLAFSGVGT